MPGPASYELTQQQAMVSLGVLYRAHLSTDLIRPYVAAGPRMYLMRTKISGQAGGESFGDNQETATQVGAFGSLGAEIHLGPGAIMAEVSMTWAKIDGYVMRDTSAGAMQVALGYRLFIYSSAQRSFATASSPRPPPHAHSFLRRGTAGRLVPSGRALERRCS